MIYSCQKNEIFVLKLHVLVYSESDTLLFEIPNDLPSPKSTGLTSFGKAIVFHERLQPIASMLITRHVLAKRLLTELIAYFS